MIFSHSPRNMTAHENYSCLSFIPEDGGVLLKLNWDLEMYTFLSLCLCFETVSSSQACCDYQSLAVK